MNAAVVEQKETQLRQAMLDGDVAVLDDLLSDRLVFTDQSGRRLTKADDLSAHRSGLLRITALDPVAPPLIRPFGDSAIVHPTVSVSGTHAGEEFSGTFACSRVWHRTDGQWRIEAGHCSRCVTPRSGGG